MIKGKDLEETIRLTALALGESLEKAALIVAFEMGETTGDVIDLADDEVEDNENDGDES
jgi:hypothetical protein